MVKCQYRTGAGTCDVTDPDLVTFNREFLILVVNEFQENYSRLAAEVSTRFDIVAVRR